MGRWGHSHHSGVDALGHWREPGPSSMTGQSPASGEENTRHRRDSFGNSTNLKLIDTEAADKVSAESVSGHSCGK